MEEKSIDNLNKGIDIAVSILKNEFTFVTGWKYKYDPDFFNSTVYILLICDMYKSSEFYNSPIKDYYKNIEADVTYPFSPLEMSTEIDNEEKYELYKEIQKSLDETYYEIPNDYRHTYKSYISNTDSPKEIYIDGFVFPAPEKLNESESVNYKVSLAKSLIHQLFDEVSFIEQSVYVSSINGKPSLTVYFDSDDTAANIESVFTHEICDTLRDYTGGEIKCAPSWGPESRRNRNNPDILIDAIQLEYDDEGNVINESKEDNITEVKKNLKVINTLLSLVSWDGLCSIWVDYNPEDEEYEIRSKTTASYFDDNNIEQELNSLEDSISSMGIRVYIYTPWHVENCEDEPEFLNESENKKSNYVNVIKQLVEPFKDEDCVCDIDVSYDEEDDMYGVYVVLGHEELNDNFFSSSAMGFYAKKLRVDINKTIVDYLPIKNLYVGSYGVPNCDWKPLNENWYKVPSSEFGPLERIINLEMREKYGWWKDIKINTLNYITMYEDVQIEAELTVDEEWGANQWRDFYYSTKFPGNKGWENNDGYSRRVSLGDITDSTYAEVIRDDLREILKYTLNIDIHNMSFRNVYLIFE
jgi:hypothetical protein